jgi:hypothetical protein
MKRIRYLVEEEDFLGPRGDKLKLTVKRGIRPADEKERKPPRYPTPEALQLIYDLILSGEFERLWNAIRTLGPLKDSSEEAKKKAALDCFDTYKGKKWKQISRTALESPAPWNGWRQAKEKGDFRGRLLQVLLAEQFMKERKKEAEKLRKKGKVEKARECEQQAMVRTSSKRLLES